MKLTTKQLERMASAISVELAARKGKTKAKPQAPKHDIHAPVLMAVNGMEYYPLASYCQKYRINREQATNAVGTALAKLAGLLRMQAPHVAGASGRCYPKTLLDIYFKRANGTRIAIVKNGRVLKGGGK